MSPLTLGLVRHLCCTKRASMLHGRASSMHRWCVIDDAEVSVVVSAFKSPRGVYDTAFAQVERRSRKTRNQNRRARKTASSLSTHYRKVRKPYE